MLPNLLLICLLCGPLVLGLLLRVGAPHLFLALLSGELIERYFGHDAEEIVASFTDSEVVLSYVRLGVLVLPVLLTAFFLKGTVKKSKVLLHVVPWVGTGLVFAAFAAPLMPPDAQARLAETFLGAWILDSINLIVGTMVALQMVYAWIIHHPKKEHHKGKKE